MTRRQLYTGIVAMLACGVIFVMPFLFVFLTAAKTRQEAQALTFTWPSEWQLWQNFMDVIEARNYMLFLAYFNSTVITVVAVTLLVLFGAMVGYVVQRRPSRWNTLSSPARRSPRTIRRRFERANGLTRPRRSTSQAPSPAGSARGTMSSHRG